MASWLLLFVAGLWLALSAGYDVMTISFNLVGVGVAVWLLWHILASRPSGAESGCWPCWDDGSWWPVLASGWPMRHMCRSPSGP